MVAGLTELFVDLLLLIPGYWLVDCAIRRGWIVRVLLHLGLLRASAQSLAVLVPAAAAGLLWTWAAVPGGESLRMLGGVLGATLAWRAVTRDIDVVVGEALLCPRLLLVVSAAGAFLSPALLISTCLLLSAPFGMWQHHATLPMRVLQAILAFVLLTLSGSAVPIMQSPAAVVFLVLVIHISHYFITALAKGYLGPRWYSWPLDNRLHHLAASAYSWGWARFLPWRQWRRVISAARTVERPLQLLVFAIEALAPLALLHVNAAIGFGIAWAAFHLGVFALSGLLFWEWIVADLALVSTIAQLPSASVVQVFGPAQCALCLVVLALFPLRHRLWKPMPLGWWDTPFTQRMHWRVWGESGTAYGLYPDFMDPHERIYGKVHGCFLAPVPVLTYHLGEAFLYELRDGLRGAGPNPDRIDALRRRFGVEPWNAILADNHRAYLHRFCWELNHGAAKQVLPRFLRFLKAPGGQCYYWGELPAYRRQERIVLVEVIYREEYFDGTALRRLLDQVVLRMPIDGGTVAPQGAREPTPKELDDHLLALAAGRLIRLPGFGEGFVRGDDGEGPKHPRRAARTADTRP